MAETNWWDIWGSIGERVNASKDWLSDNVGPNAPEDSLGYFRVPEFKALRGKTEYTKPIPLEKLPYTPNVTGDLISEYNKTKRTVKREINVEGYGKGDLVASGQYKGKIYFYPTEANRAHNEAVKQDLSDIQDITTTFTTLAGPTAALVGTKPQTQNIVMKGGRFQEGVKIPLTPKGMRDAALLSKSLNKGVKPNQGQVSTTPTSGNLASKEAALQTRISQFQAGGSKSTRDLNLTTSSAKTATGKLSKKEAIAETVDLTKTISSKNDELSKLPPKEIERRINRLKEVQAQADKMKKGSDNYLSRRSGGTGEPLYTFDKKAKEAAGVPLEAGGIQTKFGAERDSPVWQLHHAIQKKYRAAVSERMLELIEQGKATWYDFAAIEAMEESMGLIGVGDSGVQMVPEVAHSSVHTEFKMRGIEPKPGLGSDKTPKKFKPRKIPKHLEGEDLLEGPSLDIEIERLKKINTADEMMSEVRSALKEVYLPQQQRMIEMTEALQDGFPGLQANMVKNQLARDLLKDIRAGRKPNIENLSDIELAQQQANYEKLYSEWRDKVEVDMRETATRRDIVKEHKADIAQEKAIQGYEPGTPEYEYIEWMHDLELQRTRWRTGGGTQSFGRVK